MTDDQTKQELADLRAKREALRVARAEKFPEDDAVAKEKKALADEELIFELEQEHGKVGEALALVRCVDGQLIAGKKPHPATYQKFYDSKEQTFAVTRAFVLPCMVHPSDKVAQAAVIDAFPGAADKLALELARLCGADPKG